MIDGSPNDTESLKAQNRKLLEENAQLKAEIAELRRRLGMDSSNSHKPRQYGQDHPSSPRPCLHGLLIPLTYRGSRGRPTAMSDRQETASRSGRTDPAKVGPPAGLSPAPLAPQAPTGPSLPGPAPALPSRRLS